MFQGLFQRAENKLDSVVAKYVGRVTIAIPLIIAGGFATAALTAKVLEMYGAVIGYSIMAAVFAVIGLITMAVIGSEAAPATASSEPASAQTATPQDSTASADATDLLPSDLLTPEVRAFLSSAAPMALPTIARGVGRNLPLILILAIIGYVISRFASSDDTAASTAGGLGGEGDIPNDVAAAPPAA